MKRYFILLSLFIVLSVIFGVSVLAHVDDETESVEDFLDSNIRNYSMTSFWVSSVVLLVISFFTLIKKKKSPFFDKSVFIIMAIIIVLTTLFISGSTIYINIISESNGPVHWHADFEIWNCNELVDLKDPDGLLNKIGTSVFHEHNDQRIHVEGAIIEKSNVNLHSFFEKVGGDLIDDKMIIPTESGIIEMNNGDLCNGEEGELQVFLYKVTNPDSKKKSGFTFEQTKLDSFPDYVLSPYSNIPPGDCVIVEFGEEKETTDRICDSYELAIQKGDLTYGG